MKKTQPKIQLKKESKLTLPKRVKKAKPTTDKGIIREDIAEMASLQSMANSEGGKILAHRTLKAIVSTMDGLSSSYTHASHPELQALCARLSERLGLYRTLINADENLVLAQDALAEALINDPD